eukprot:753073-Amphidinium_carterae.1
MDEGVIKDMFGGTIALLVHHMEGTKATKFALLTERLHSWHAVPMNLQHDRLLESMFQGTPVQD